MSGGLTAGFSGCRVWVVPWLVLKWGVYMGGLGMGYQ